MEMRAGYKRTDAGIIPEDWKVNTLGEIGDVRMCKRVLKQQTRSNGDVPFYKIGTFGGVADAYINHSLFEEFKRKYSYPKKGDVLISAAGTIGRSVIFDGSPSYFQDSNIVWIENDESKATNEYLWHRYQVTKWAVSHGGTVARLYNDSLRTKIYVPVPTLSEQRAISQALSDVDALIAVLDRLIAKKRDIKQATMQQLLTGKTRLPGYSSSWDVASLDMLATRTAGVWGSNLHSERNCRRAQIIRAGDISQDGRLTGTATRYISSDEFDRAACGLDDLVITTSGNGLGKLWCCDGRENLVASNFVRVMHPIPKLAIGRFLGFALRTIEGIRQLREHTATSAYPNLRPTYFSTKWIPLPPPEEQMAIAAILSDMDAELIALEARRDKTRNLKQGMMQELLTGKTRLI
jgi:type I restriction enzyme S subunit